MQGKNALGKDPLTMAVERGHFPANMLHLFTCCFDGLEKEASAEGRVQAFLRVAMTCPDAAPKLVRTKPRRLLDLKLCKRNDTVYNIIYIYTYIHVISC